MVSTIGKRVEAAIQQMAKGETDSALHDICSAIEFTAKRETGKGGGRTYKDFIHNNLGLITKVGLGVSILNLNIAFDHPKVKRNPDGTTTIQEIFFHVVRCGLYHDASLPSNLMFSEEHVIKCNHGKTLVIPASLVHGLIVAVVASPANSGEVASSNAGLNINGLQIPFNLLWGKRDELLSLYDALEQVHKVLRTIDSGLRASDGEIARSSMTTVPPPTPGPTT